MSNKFIPYGRQNINLDDIFSVVNTLKSDYLTQGPQIELFEKNVSKEVSSNHAITFNSATSALHVACLSLGLKKGDILWTSPITFVASANCALYCNAKVDFVDINPATGLICIADLRKKLINAKKKNLLPKIIIPVHLSGTSCDMREIFKLSKEFGFYVIEDASHAIGGVYENNLVGSCKFSDITIFSLHPVKIITSAEGGIATTNNLKLAHKMKLLRSHGITKNKSEFINKDPDDWSYEQQKLGFNYRMPDILAALGLSQLKRLNSFIKERNKIYLNYKEFFSSLPISFLEIPNNIKSSHHLLVIRLQKNDKKFQRHIFKIMRENNIGVQIHYNPVHLQPYYKKLGFKKGLFPNSESYASDVISLPIFPGLKKSQIKRVYKALSTAIKSY